MDSMTPLARVAGPSQPSVPSSGTLSRPTFSLVGPILATSEGYTGAKMSCGPGLFDLGQEREDVGLLGLEGLLGHDLAAELLEVAREDGLQALAVLVAGDVDHRGLVDLQLLAGELRRGRALLVVGEADAEHVLLVARDLDVRRARGDERHLRLLGVGGGAERGRRRGVAHHAEHAVAVDELLDLLAGEVGVEPRVLVEHLDLAAVDAAGGVDLLEGYLHALLGLRSERAVLAREA